jgi:hypothetical protein
MKEISSVFSLQTLLDSRLSSSSMILTRTTMAECKIECGSCVDLLNLNYIEQTVDVRKDKNDFGMIETYVHFYEKYK